MKPLKTISVFIAQLLLCVTSAAIAKNDGIDPSVTVEKDIETYVVSQDGSFVMNKDMVYLINEERAIKSVSQRALSYNRTLEALEVIEAYTQKPDGRKVIVTPDKIKDQQEPQSVGAPMFMDTRLKVIIFPEVATGDRLIFKYKLNRHTPYFPKQFSDLSTPHVYGSKQLSRIYDLPESMILNVDAKGFSASVPTTEKSRKRYQWDYVASDRARAESGSVAYLDYGDHLIVSTFASYSEWASAYDARAKDKAGITPKIQALAEKITKDLNDPRAKSMALADWMRKNIRYVASYIGAGGFVPHAADTILDNLYGDCKDHVTLLEAMLTAVGIDSTPALINAGNSFRLSKVPFGFNHVITYIPSLDLYTDSTAASVASNYLPTMDLDKQVLLVRTGKLGHTPASQNDKLVLTTAYKISANGSADFEHAAISNGYGAETSRYSVRNLKLTDRDLLVERLLQKSGQKGSGTLNVGNLDAKSDEYELKMTVHSDNMVNLPGPVGMSTVTGFFDGIAPTIFRYTAEKERTQDFQCGPANMEETARFELAKEITIVSMPKPLTIHDGMIDFSSTYTKDGNALVIKRSFQFHHDGRVCTPDDFKKRQSSIDQIMRDIRSQIIVQAL